jgi:hypothetical protein
MQEIPGDMLSAMKYRLHIRADMLFLQKKDEYRLVDHIA